MKVDLIKYPSAQDWVEVKRRALVTVGLKPVSEPTTEWKKSILRARHSPIRFMMFSFLIECPYWVSVHLARHVHAQPYVRSQRNDRQDTYDRNAARQDAPVTMILDVNAEELIVIANKRLCRQASEETQAVVRAMRDEVLKVCPEFMDELVPMCVRNGGECHEMYSCRR